MRFLRAAAMLLFMCPVSVHAQAPVTAAGDKTLSRRVTLTASNELLADVLTTLRRDMHVPLAWSGDIIPDGQRVTLSFRDVALRGVLDGMLAGSGLGYVVTQFGTVVIVPRAGPAPAPSSAAEAVERREVALGLAATGVPQLDAVVVMGSAVSRNPEREQPTAVGVVNRGRIAAIPNATVADIMRTMLPGVILWDRGPAGPPAPIAAVRGVSSFTTRALKTYVDGIELASPELFTLVDPRSIERIELIRGPQGAALYGPDALNGILQIETRHGRVGKGGVEVRGSASAGSLEQSTNTEPAQDYSAGVSANAQSSALDVGGAFAHVGSSATVPLMRTWSLNGGARALTGSFLVDASARIGQRRYATDSSAASPDSPTARDLEERGFALTAVHTVSDHFRQTLVAGYHRASGVREPFRSPLLTPTLPLGATDETASRSSLRYSGVADFWNAFTLSAGAELSRRQIERSARTGPNPANLLSLSRDDLRSTGGFVQGRLRVASHLVLSGGTRAEHLSSVAPGVGLLWASTAGASWTQETHFATVRWRAAWGNGIRPPEPGMNKAMERSGIQQLANADLLPERQRGIEAGADVFVANNAFVKFTWYDQRALDLIQQVRVRKTDTTTLTYQFQNFGAVRNRGIELEGGYHWRQLSAAATAYFPSSKVERVSPSYGGELRTGDRLIEVPDAAGSASLRYDAGRMHAEVGASWIGAWSGYDWLLIQGATNNQVPRRPAERDYRRDYPGVTRPFVALSVDLPREYHAFIRVDNPANKAAFIRDNLSPPLGRSAMVGVTLRP